MMNHYRLYLGITAVLFYICPLVVHSQTMTPEVYAEWNKIESVQLADSGEWVSYRVTNENQRSDLYLYNKNSQQELVYHNSKDLKFLTDDSHAVFIKTVHPDTIRQLKLAKVKKSKLPKDTLCILNLETGDIERIRAVISYKIPEAFPKVIAFKLAERSAKQDSTLVKKEGKENGSRLVIKNLQTGQPKAIPYVLDYVWSPQNGRLLIHTVGPDSLNQDKILMYDAGKDKFLTLRDQVAEYHQLTFSDDGSQIAFLSQDSTAVGETQNQLWLWKEGQARALRIADDKSSFLPDGYQLSLDRAPVFLESFDKLVYGIAAKPLEKDTTLLPEESAVVDIWHYQDGLIQPQQAKEKEKKLKESYTAIYDLKSRRSSVLNDQRDPQLKLDQQHKGAQVLSYTNEGYQQYLTWLGHDYKDVFLTDIHTGKKRQILTAIAGRPRLSPSGHYVSWYSSIDTSWNAFDIKKNKQQVLSQGRFYDELNDRPMHPRASGQMMWTKDDKLLVYDHYDIWLLSPDGKRPPERLTTGRETSERFRYVNLDQDIKILPRDTTILLKTFNTETKEAGYQSYNLKTKKLTPLVAGPYAFNTIVKAKDSDDIVFTRESFDLFPDLIGSQLDFKTENKISDANPQQADYNWGSIENYNWVDHKGIKRKALLAKPADFDANKKYPLIVNFYEKSSDRLYHHRAPYAHRSTINYTYYTNKGYVIFNPDVYYEDGYPGESCYKAIMSSVSALVEEGFIDTTKMGLQGHSWGGYQIAYLLTKTDKFICAEAGAPVVNMVSAYGGVRWRSGRSRMFQYERTQSRLGATLWERPDLYLYNSPIFNLDRVKTPVLILHNDKDGAVPWYQGIEYFMGLRRLGKPAWMLNYNDEPHWPVKKPNRIDFNKRMEQFFDHYLMDQPMPVWMKSGVPAVEKGLNDGLQYSELRIGN